MEIIQAIRKEIINRINKRHLSEQAKNELVSILAKLSDLEKKDNDGKNVTTKRNLDSNPDE